MNYYYYDVEKLNKVIKNFVIATGLSVSILKPDFSFITACEGKNSEYCVEIHKNPIGYKKCGESDYFLLAECKKERKPVSRICHAGLVDTAVPLISNDEIIAYILIGRIKQNISFDEVEKTVKWLDSVEILKNKYENVKYYSDEQIKSLSELMIMLTSYIITNEIIKTKKDEFSEKINIYLKENLKEKITVGELCKKFNISKNALYKKFHESFQTSVCDYINILRIEKAKEMLKNTDESIISVSENVGIDNYPYFCRLFKNVTGLTPMGYKKINKKL